MAEKSQEPNPEITRMIEEMKDYIHSLPRDEGAAMALHFSLAGLEMKDEVTLTEEQARKYGVLLERLKEIISKGGIKDTKILDLVRGDFARLELYIASARRTES